jgi:predicted GIY-YIG superfamily endonuclease
MARFKHTDKSVISLAKACKSYTDFCKNHDGAYKYARKHPELFSEIKQILPTRKKPRGFWESKNNCIEYAKNYDSIMEFRTAHKKAYENCLKNNWKDEAFAHMVDPRIGQVAHNFKWSKKVIVAEAKKYDTRSEFEKAAPGAYKTAAEQGYLDEICGDMRTVGHAYKRAIYAIEFEDRSVYVGLTYDYKARFSDHLNNSSNRHVKDKLKSGIGYKLVEFGEWYDNQEARLAEESTVKKYDNDGYSILNIARVGSGGSLGSSRKEWTKERALETARKCNSPTEFKKRFVGAWTAAHKDGYIEECYEHMTARTVPRWTKELVFDAALKCKTRTEFRSRFPTAWRMASKNGYMDECCSHMEQAKGIGKVNKGSFTKKWTKEDVLLLAQKCKTRSEFQKRFPGAKEAARRYGYLDLCQKHMPPDKRQFWTKESALAAARKCDSQKEFYQKYKGAYAYALKNGCIEECYQHMN